MLDGRDRIFRKEALERLSSPERLDQLVELVDPHTWIALAALTLLIAAALVWSVVGHLPTIVTGRGVLGQPRGVAEPGVGVIFFEIKDGTSVQPGMRAQVIPDSVQRERFGTIAGRIRSVSPSPVAKSGAAHLIGSSEIADSFLSKGPLIETIVDLERDPATISGYRWSYSPGPPMRIAPGTTATARVTVENRAPITYILPLLRSTDGGH
jgi:hypothetical protein